MRQKKQMTINQKISLISLSLLKAKQKNIKKIVKRLNGLSSCEIELFTKILRVK